MGIKTMLTAKTKCRVPLKNLPTTWGLRRSFGVASATLRVSEKPPHHMGIKTPLFGLLLCVLGSEKPPHHMGIKTD